MCVTPNPLYPVTSWTAVFLCGSGGFLFTLPVTRDRHQVGVKFPDPFSHFPVMAVDKEADAYHKRRNENRQPGPFADFLENRNRENRHAE